MVLFTGKTVEDAIEKGLAELHLSRMKAHIQVISREKKGFLGFGKRPAKVDIEAINPIAIQRQKEAQPSSMEETKELKKVTSIIKKLEEREKKQVPVKAEKDLGETQVFAKSLVTEAIISENEDSSESSVEPLNSVDTSEEVEEVVATDISLNEAAKAVAEYIQNIIYEMDVEASLEITCSRRHIDLQIETMDAGRVIGYHGKVLKSLQLLAQNFLHDRYEKHYSVFLNVHDYVEHRTETLIDFTHKVAKRVIESQENYIMDSMSNQERKIVHKTVASIAGVASHSEGSDPNRYVVITPQ